VNKQTKLLVGVAAALACTVASTHNTLTSYYVPAGYMQDLEIRVTHGCKDSPVKEFRVKIPDGVVRVQTQYTRDWTVEKRMRKLPKPVPGDGGNMITETVDEIIWKNPKSPMPAAGVYEGFHFRAAIPDTPGQILFFRSINVCASGEERYVDLPTEPLDASTPNLPEKLLKFMMATPTPSAFVIIEKPTRPQYPFASMAPKK